MIGLDDHPLPPHFRIGVAMKRLRADSDRRYSVVRPSKCSSAASASAFVRCTTPSR
jgi:hypothetical protein